MKNHSSLGRITMSLPLVKKVITIIMLAIICVPSSSLLAQTGCEIPLEFVLRNQQNVLVKDSSMTVKISVLESSASGTVVYQETHASTSSPYGTVSLVIGEGNLISGDFSIPWSENDYYIQTKVDLGSGTFIDFGTEKLVGLPCQVVVPTEESIVVMNNLNYQSIQGQHHDIVKIEEMITLDDFYYDAFQGYSSVQFFGGGFIGSPNAETIELGNYAIFNSVRFENVKFLSGSRALFLNCTFIGNISFPSLCTIKGGLFSNVTSQEIPNILSISGVEILNSTIKEVERVTNCYISDCTIGQPTISSSSDKYRVKIFANNEINNSTIYPSKTVSGNDFERCYIEISDTDRISITGNNFKDNLSGSSEIISIKVNDLGSGALIGISSNVFYGDGITSLIKLSGFNINEPMMNISNNIFSSNTPAISDTSSDSAKMLVSDNVLNGTTTIGVGNLNAIRIVTENHLFN